MLSFIPPHCSFPPLRAPALPVTSGFRSPAGKPHFAYARAYAQPSLSEYGFSQRGIQPANPQGAHDDKRAARGHEGRAVAGMAPSADASTGDLRERPESSAEGREREGRPTRGFAGGGAHHPHAGALRDAGGSGARGCRTPGLPDFGTAGLRSQRTPGLPISGAAGFRDPHLPYGPYRRHLPHGRYRPHRPYRPYLAKRLTRHSTTDRAQSEENP
nr:hypothetical protein StreXyl84_23100 [Streptomyces sp. Xyl84]